MQTPDKLEVIWGAAKIGEEIGLSRRQTQHLIDTGQLPATKVGWRWASTRSQLRERFLSDREDKKPAEAGASEAPDD
jgi:hypothetical protein